MEIYCDKTYSMAKQPVWQTALSQKIFYWGGCGMQALNHIYWARSCSVQDLVVLWSRITFCWKLQQQPSWLLGSSQLALPVAVHKNVSPSLQSQFRLFEALCGGVADARSRLLFNAFATAVITFTRGKETKDWSWLCFKSPHWVISSHLLELRPPTDHGKCYYTEKKRSSRGRNIKKVIFFFTDFFLCCFH